MKRNNQLVTNNIKVNEVSIKGEISLKVIDTKTGKTVKEIKKSNTDTIIAKFNVPTQNTLYMDLITKPLDSIFGQQFTKVSKTAIHELDTIRSGNISTAFSYDSSSMTYTASFNWTNTNIDPVQIYGLLSYTNYNNENVIMTILDLTDEQIILEQNYQIIGKYIITFSQPTPDTTQNSVNFIKVTSNNVITSAKVDKAIRDYKYTRAFTQTTYHYGVDISEVPNSIINATITSSNSTTSKAFGDDSQIFFESVYEITQDGSPGSAKAKRYFVLPTVSSWAQSSLTPNDYSKFNMSGVTINSLVFNPYKKEIVIKPLKIRLPQPLDDMSFLRSYNGHAYPSLTFGYKNSVGSLYIYWNPDTTTEIYVYGKPKYNYNVYLLKPDGTKVYYSQIISDILYKIDLPDDVNEGLVVVSCGFDFQITKMIFGNEVYVYGSWLPGPLQNGTAQVFNQDGTLNTITTDKITNKGQFYSCRKEDYENGSILGILNDSVTLISGYYNSFTIPYKVGDGFLGYINDSQVFYSDYYYNRLYTLIPEGLIKATNNEVTLTFKDVFLPSAYYTNDNLPKKIVFVYNNGDFDLKFKDEIEDSIINQNETLGDLSIQFTSDSTFKASEYWKFPINDSDTILLTDALEEYEVADITKINYDNEFWNRDSESSGFKVIKSSDDFVKLAYTPQDIEVKIPNFNVLDTEGKRKPNRVAVYEIAFEGDSSTYSVLLLPKTIIDKTTNEELIVDTSTILVTDGMHVIPHETSLYPDGWQTDNDIEYQDKYWKIKVDNRTLKELYGDNNTLTKVQLYVFFEAKKKEDLLPFEVEMSIFNYDLPDGSNDTIFRVDLPFVTDGYIKVVDDKGNSYDFEILKTSLKRLESDSDKGNILFIKIPVVLNKLFLGVANNGNFNTSGSSFTPASGPTLISTLMNDVAQWYSDYGSSVINYLGDIKFEYLSGYNNFSYTYKPLSFIKTAENKFQFLATTKRIINTLFPKVYIVPSSSNNNKNLLLENYNIFYDSKDIVGKYIKNVSVSVNQNNTDMYLKYDETGYSPSLKFTTWYKSIYWTSYTGYNFETKTVVRDVIKSSKASKVPWTKEYVTVYYYKSLPARVKHHLSIPKLDKNYIGTDFTYDTIFYQPITIEDTSSSVYMISRTKKSVFDFNTPVRTINIKQPIKILTKHYTLSDLNVYGKVTDVNYPVSNSTESYLLNVYYAPYAGDLPNKLIFKSSELQQILQNSGYPSDTIKAITSETFNSLNNYSNTSSTLTYINSNTGYYVINNNKLSVNRPLELDSEITYMYTNDYSVINHITTQNYQIPNKTIEINITDSTYSFDTTEENVTYQKLNQIKFWRYSTPSNNSLILANEEIPFDKVENFGKFSIEYYSNEVFTTTDTTKHFRFYPVIKVKNTSTGEEKLYAIDVMQRPIDITNHYNEWKNGKNVSENWLKYLIYNRFTYEDFNSLLSLYKDGNGTYVFSYGFIWHVPSDAPKYQYEFKGLTISPEFNDDTMYNEIKWCWINTKSGLLSDDKEELIPDTVNNKIKIYNPNDSTLTIPIKISLKDAGIDTLQFTDGVIVKDANNNILPSCYVSKYGVDKPTDNFGYWDNDGIYVRVTLQPKSVTEVIVDNGTLTSTINDVFDFVDNFESIDTNKWTLSYTPIEYQNVTWNSNLDLGGTDTDNDGSEDYHTYGSEIGCMFECVRPIELTKDQTLIIRGDETGTNIHGIYSNNTLSNITNKSLHIRYKVKSNVTNLDFEIGYNHSNFTSLPSSNSSADSIRRSNTDVVKVFKGTSVVKSYTWLNIPDVYLKEDFCWTGKIRLDVEKLINLKFIEYSPIPKVSLINNSGQTPNNTDANIGLFVKTDKDNNIEIDWIYVTESYDREPIVLYEKDLEVAIPENNSTWFIIDTSNPSSPDKSTIQSLIDSYDRYPYVYEHVNNDEYDYWYWKLYDGYFGVYNALNTTLGFINYRKL